MPYSTLRPLAEITPSEVLASPSAKMTLDKRTTLVYDSIVNDALVVIENAIGSPSVSIVIKADVASNVWTDIVVSVSDTADSGVATSLNRLLKGFALDGLPGSKPPALRKYWRTKSLALAFKRRSVALPAAFTLKYNLSMSATYWSLTSATKRTVTTAPTATPPSVSEPKPEPLAPMTLPSAKKSASKPSANTALPTDHPGIFRMLPPKGRFSVWQDASTKRKLQAALDGHLSGDRTFVVLRGPTGSGKTISAMDLAARNALPFWKVDVAGLRDFGDWAGYNQPSSVDGVLTLDYVPSQFITAIDADGPYAGITRMVMLDEITRVETAGALNALLPVTDGTGSLYVSDAKRSIRVDPAVIFVATANIGAAFSGTVTLDIAFVNRATHTVPVGFPPKTSEVKVIMEQSSIDRETATRLVTVAHQTRIIAATGEIPVGVSTRQLVAAAKAVMTGLLPLEAAETAFADTYSDEGGSTSHRAKVLQAVNGSLRGYEPAGQREPEAPDGVTASTTTNTAGTSTKTAL